MKKYTIHYNYYATIDVEVLAENEEEAKLKADLVEVDANDYDFSLKEQSVVDVEDGEAARLCRCVVAVTVGKVRVEHQGRELYLLLLLIGFILILAELATFQLLVSVE